MFHTDMILNGQAQGELADSVLRVNFDTGLLRPYFNEKGIPCVTVRTGKPMTDRTGKIVRNKRGQPMPGVQEVSIQRYLQRHPNAFNILTRNATSLRKDEWIELDNAVVKAARERLRAWTDLLSMNSYGGFNAMGKSILEWETQDDPGSAQVDMDALSESQSDEPRYQLEGLPLPITHSDFHFAERRMMISRNTGEPIDVTQAEAAGRRVAETIEKTLIGTVTGLTFGTASNYSRNPTVYGYTNFPARNTKSDMTAPTGSNGPTILTDWLALRDLLYDANMYGPYMVYTSTDYDQYLDNLFSTSEPSAGTLRKRLLEVDGIMDIRRLDFLTNTFTVIMVQMTSDVARAIDGMPLTTIQWDSQGGLRKNFKVMAIQVPQLRADYSGNCGIAHGTTA